MKTQEYVFVHLFISLGDADSQIEEHAIIQKEIWEKEAKKFTDYLMEKGLDYIELDSDYFGSYQFNLDCYEIMPCTFEEKQVIEKFFGESDTIMIFPMEYVNE
jgi:hypothetical protein